MEGFSERQFKEYWRKTEVICEYEQMLYTFGDMTLPYLFVGEHQTYDDRTVIRSGVVYIQKPNIVLPGQNPGPEFGEGFEHSKALPKDAVLVIRSMGLPYSQINNKQTTQDKIEYGRLQKVIDNLKNKLERQGDTTTGLIKGVMCGADISLMRYSLGLMIRSAPANVRQFFEHIRRRSGKPISSDEKITDEDLKRLFG